MDPKLYKFDTLSLHGGQRPDAETGARAVPIYQTTSYVFQDSDHAAALFNLEQAGHIYSRISNPTVAVLEERIAALEGGTGAVATASGQSALFLSLLTLLDSGSHIVASASLYGGSINLLRHTLPRFGITTTFVHPRDLKGFRKAIRPETRLVFGEVIGNPGLEILDLKAVSSIAHEVEVPLLIDATFNTPYLCRPFEWGVDLVMHSVTKWMGGHGVAIGGIVVDSGLFDWEASGKFPTLTEPYAGYHGINFMEEFGATHAFTMRARSEGMRDFGPAMSPQNAFYLLQGLETLPLRMERHISNTKKLLEFLQSSEEVAWVTHPDLTDHPDHELASRILPKGAGSIIVFGVKAGSSGGGREAGAAFINSVKLASHLANVGDAKTLVIHPASTTHAQMDAETMKQAGLTEDMIRLSVGMEDPGDIIEDLRQAFRVARKATGGAA
ncbi:MAG TPA: O-acetylhomoserine aminocarboxypropyltransferase [Deltaproteobacteria bacterium]|nr:O-acetylhomoserine aminocarboxypropyltransferase [SAR324 cluster bacterium]HBL56132.1 O-acetylhomoserine aminocarboxypropyltransferase [Deltaproteobacteria bacterium]HHZ77763.1 O-acetylhomoserine aminocarboxypropyltransferase [Candidatus Lambdaproteobacteria bacterium]HIA57630.1 O-acetylhomoserine aminocarboxypropyltransferase [Candidatus Lambdaproteobacteria bacterium]HIB92963.1 O-acetylhomoserine aminocarboxypropyltransferase [Candidatus Lambdaproteobacteria bacterium]